MYKPVFWAERRDQWPFIAYGLYGNQSAGSHQHHHQPAELQRFHGRIGKQYRAATIEQLKGEYPDSSLLLSAGDNIGASLFNSSVQQDQPTIDVLNALGVKASAVGNQLCRPYRPARRARAMPNGITSVPTYKKGTTTPALPEYSIQEVNGVVGIIGAVTQETSTLPVV